MLVVRSTPWCSNKVWPKKTFISEGGLTSMLSLIISLYLTISSTELPKSDSIDMPDLVWRVLTVSAGAYGSHQLTGISKIVKTIITPLADFQVSVLVISTYQSDYVLVGLELLGSLVSVIKSNPALRIPHHYRQFVPGQRKPLYFL